MFIDGITGMTLSNNVLRIQVARTDAAGNTSFDNIFLPASNINQFVNGIVDGVKELNTQLEAKSNEIKDNADDDVKSKAKGKAKDKASLADVDEKSN